MVFPVDKCVPCIYFCWKAIYGDLPSKMALAFKTSDMILTKEQTEHINFHHIEINGQCALKFKRNFNLTATLVLLTQKTWVTELEGNYEIIDCGFKHGHGEYYICSQDGKGNALRFLWFSQSTNMYIVYILAGKRSMEIYPPKWL